MCAREAWAYSRVLPSRCGPDRSHGPICCQPRGRRGTSTLQGCRACTRVGQLCTLAGECSHRSDFTLSILTNVRLVQVMGGTGNQTSLLQLHFQIDEKQTLLPAVSSQFLHSAQFLDMSDKCSRQHPSLDHVSWPCSVFPIITPWEHGLSA